MNKTVRVLAWAAVVVLVAPSASVSADAAQQRTVPSTDAVDGAKSARPKAPAQPSRSIEGSSIRLTWKAPANGGAPITDYKVECSSNKGKKWRTINDGVRKKPGATVTKLKKGVAWTCRVSARNKVGWGPASKATKPITIPDGPTELPRAFTGTLKAETRDTQGLSDVQVDITIDNARFEIVNRLLGEYRFVSGTAEVSAVGTSGMCSIDHTTTIALTTADVSEISQVHMTVVDLRFMPRAGTPPAGTGPVYYQVLAGWSPPTLPYTNAGESGCQYGYPVRLTALMNVGEPNATAWEFPSENDLRHDTDYTFSGTRTLPFDSSMLDRTYTFGLAPVG